MLRSSRGFGISGERNLSFSRRLPLYVLAATTVLAVALFPGLCWAGGGADLVMRISEWLLVATDMEDMFRPQYIAIRESIEIYAVLFVLAYLWDVRRRMKAEG